MIYLDAAAVVKLAHAENESDALRAWLSERAETGWISSVLLEIEASRALARYAPEAVVRLHPVIDLIELVEPGCEAARPAQPQVRASRRGGVAGASHDLGQEPVAL